MVCFGLYYTFTYTEEAHHMRDIVIEETMYDMDKNRDGKITLEEYISKHVSLSHINFLCFC